MRLADLHPRWIEIGGRRVGIVFDCPCCVDAPVYPVGAPVVPDRTCPGVTKWRAGPLAIFFRNPNDGGLPHPVDFESRVALADVDGPHRLGDCHIGGVHWTRTGDTFETLTLSPSVDASAWKHWHGFVRDGAIT